jgi:hypothetical protein
MSFAEQHITWVTYAGDVVKVFSTAEPDDEGGVAVRWHWRRIHLDGRRILARSAEPKKRRKDALWEAQRVNPKVGPT